MDGAVIASGPAVVDECGVECGAFSETFDGGAGKAADRENYTKI